MIHRNIPFSNLDRSETLKALQSSIFDLIVIGGGITGAGIALDAASRGLSVALIEKGDFASGTSSKSTKLIHGGLRYLKQFDFWLVKEVGSERAIVHKLAPHLVLPEKMLLPLIKKGSYGKWLTSIGLKIYDILAEVEGGDQRKMLEKEEALKLEPLLPRKILKGAGYYAEYRTDDARLTLENIKTALRFKTVALNYLEVESFCYTNEQLSGVRVIDRTTEINFEIQGKQIVNATGPWVDELRMLNNSGKGKQKRLHLTKGVHLVFPHKKLPVKQSVYFDVPDGRMIFAIPRGNVTYVGTTDTNYADDKNNIEVDLTDALYLLSAVNHMFPEIELTLHDITSSWAGLRPLIHEEGKSPSELSRKDEIFVSDSGLISIAGGKLTGYRKMAERVVDRVCKNLKEKHQLKTESCYTDKIPLSGSKFKSFDEVEKYIRNVYYRIKKDGFEMCDARYLVTTYGVQTETILTHYNQLEGDDIKEKLIRSEFWFCVHFEMTVSPLDFFIRRTGRMYFNMESVMTFSEVILNEFKTIFGTSEEVIKVYREQIKQEIHRCTHFSN